MRFRLGVAVAAMAAVLGLAGGCGNPGGVDGNLLDDWQQITVPAAFSPDAGTCHLATFARVGTRDAYEKVDCKLRHRSETVYVGTYPNPAAQASAPPVEDSAAERAAYRTCDLETTRYVGGPWRTARLWIGVTHPAAAAWTGGARWFRCEVLEISSIEDEGGLVQRAGTLKDALEDPASDLLLTCYKIQLDSAGAIQTMPPANCGAKHNAEFVGIWYAGKLDYPTTAALWDRFHDGCRKLIAAYVGVPDDANQQYRTGVVSLPGGEDVWALGDKGVRCYLWVDGAALTSSLRGKGVKGLPIQYK